MTSLLFGFCKRLSYSTVVAIALGSAALAGGCASPPPPDIPTERIGPDILTSLAAADFGNAIPGVFGKDYTYPTHDEVDYYAGKGMTELRIPFRWERLQPTLNGAFDATELGRLDDIVGYTVGKGVGVLLDPHNYARYNQNVIGAGVTAADLADFWGKLADHYKASPTIDFGLMNEPHDMATEDWIAAANASIQAIRATGATNMITVSGNGWDSALSWNQNWYGTANGGALLQIVDPADNLVFEAHQYFDTDGSGTDGECVSEDIGIMRLTEFTAWLRKHKKRGFLGEFGTGTSATCLAALENTLAFIDSYADVYAGWTWWAGGPWWGSYMFTSEPDSEGNDRAQMTVMIKHL